MNISYVFDTYFEVWVAGHFGHVTGNDCKGLQPIHSKGVSSSLEKFQHVHN